MRQTSVAKISLIFLLHDVTQIFDRWMLSNHLWNKPIDVEGKQLSSNVIS